MDKRGYDLFHQYILDRKLPQPTPGQSQLLAEKYCSLRQYKGACQPKQIFIQCVLAERRLKD